MCNACTKINFTTKHNIILINFFKKLKIYRYNVLIVEYSIKGTKFWKDKTRKRLFQYQSMSKQKKKKLSSSKIVKNDKKCDFLARKIFTGRKSKAIDFIFFAFCRA